MLKKFKEIFLKNRQQQETVDIHSIIGEIKQKEAEKNIASGRRIHSFSYNFYQLSLDRDITQKYRVTIHREKERIYSFTIFTEGDYEKLERAYNRILSFLRSKQNITDLPDNDLMKGFFYGK